MREVGDESSKGMGETGENYVTIYALSFDRNRNRAKETKPIKKTDGSQQCKPRKAGDLGPLVPPPPPSINL